MSPVVTQLPTMTSLKGMDGMTTQELKEALARQQLQAMEMGASMHRLSVLVHRQSEVIASLVDAHDADDKGAIALTLQRLSDGRKATFKPTAQH